MERVLYDMFPAYDVMRVAREARAAGVRVAVLSNSLGREPFDPYAPYHLRGNFDAVVLSAEHGIRKPDPAIFQLALDRLGLPLLAHVPQGRSASCESRPDPAGAESHPRGQGTSRRDLPVCRPFPSSRGWARRGRNDTYRTHPPGSRPRPLAHAQTGAGADSITTVRSQVSIESGGGAVMTGTTSNAGRPGRTGAQQAPVAGRA
jgi:hypothetical protein